MAGTQLTPEKITSPFQLMAAWFAMLILVVAALLAGAANIDKPDWAAGYLVIFASIVILLVIACVILMLTKFRPHLQEGKEYAQWLKDQSAYSSGYVVKAEATVIEGRAKRIRGSSNKQSLRSVGNFLISVVNAVGGIELVEALKNEGYNAELYQGVTKNEQKQLPDVSTNGGVWIGSRLQPGAAIKAIKIAVAHWPDLKFLYISGDKNEPPDYVNDQLFLGGASEAVQRYRLRAWTQDELAQLTESMTLDEFHAAVRRKYL